MQTDLPETVNVFIGRKEAEEITKDATPYERYIISQNTTLGADNKELTLKIVELTARVEELEDIEDRSDRRSANIQGILKNFHEVSKWQQEAMEHQQIVVRYMKHDVHKYERKLWFHNRLLAGVLIAITMFSYEFLSIACFMQVATCALVIIPFQESSRLNLPKLQYIEIERAVTELKQKISDANKANDYIHEFLDTL